MKRLSTARRCSQRSAEPSLLGQPQAPVRRHLGGGDAADRLFIRILVITA